MEDKYQINHKQLCDINILAARVNAIGEFLQCIRPTEIIADVQELYNSFGQILSEAASDIYKITDGADEEYIRQLKADTEPIPAKEG